MGKSCFETRMAILETKLSNIDEKLDAHILDQKQHETKIEQELEKNNKLNDERFRESQKTMMDFIKSSDQRYAPYGLMTIAKGAGVGSVVLIIYYILTHIGLPTL
jgi:hypothetical protein